MTTYKEVFQLAQEKGYRISFADDVSDVGIIKVEDYLWGDEDEAKQTHSIQALLEISLIELTLIQKWLRDKHNLAVLVTIPFDVFWRYVIDGINGNGYYTDSDYKDHKEFDTYEQALLEGIYEALKLIK